MLQGISRSLCGFIRFDSDLLTLSVLQDWPHRAKLPRGWRLLRRLCRQPKLWWWRWLWRTAKQPIMLFVRRHWPFFGIFFFTTFSGGLQTLLFGIKLNTDLFTERLYSGPEVLLMRPERPFSCTDTPGPLMMLSL